MGCRSSAADSVPVRFRSAGLFAILIEFSSLPMVCGSNFRFPTLLWSQFDVLVCLEGFKRNFQQGVWLSLVNFLNFQLPFELGVGIKLVHNFKVLDWNFEGVSRSYPAAV